MADQPFESGGNGERVWDEYDWERFLQQQDRKTEKYMDLLDKYLDDPNRDQIIAREMGWHHLTDEHGKDWSAGIGDIFVTFRNGGESGDAGEEEDFEDDEPEDDDAREDDDASDDEDDLEDDEEANLNSHENHPLYQASNALAIHVDGMFGEQEPISQHPAVARLTTSTTLTNVKLAGALSDDEEEPGMTIAYLKRALKAITNALDAVGQCQADQLFDHEGAQDLRMRIFHVRDGIVSLMGHHRNEWRRRYGP